MEKPTISLEKLVQALKTPNGVEIPCSSVPPDNDPAYNNFDFFKIEDKNGNPIVCIKRPKQSQATTIKQ